MIFLKPGDMLPSSKTILSDSFDDLIAIGGDLSPQILLTAYQYGTFPWYEEDPILWWNPRERMVLFTKNFYCSRSLRKCIQKNDFNISMDECYSEVMHECSAPRRGQKGSWLNPEMIYAYKILKEMGVAHSIEVHKNGELVGGAYGLCLGHIFYGESMFSRITNASKVALFFLNSFLLSHGFRMIDCQVYTDHLHSLGGSCISRELFLQLLEEEVHHKFLVGSWSDIFAKFIKNFG